MKVVQGLDIGSGPSVTFLVDSAQYTFGYGGFGDAMPPYCAIDTGGGNSLACTQRDTSSASLDGLTFYCSSPP